MKIETTEFKQIMHDFHLYIILPRATNVGVKSSLPNSILQYCSGSSYQQDNSQHEYNIEICNSNNKDSIS
jgi:hypothetical protein